MVKIIFFQPHPDDLDVFCPQLLFHLAKKSKHNYEIKIASMTRGEEGIKNRYKGFKGKRIAKIRTRELYRALDIYGIKLKHIHFFEMINNNIKFNKKSVELVKNFLDMEKPDIVFAPEPRCAYYRHQDHIITGKIIYYIIEKKLIFKIPKLYCYASINPNFYWPFKKKDFSLIYKLTNIYKSQYWMYQQIIPIHKLMGRLYGKKLKMSKYAEGYRRIFFGVKKYKNRKLNFFQQIFQIINRRVSIPISLSILIGFIF